jgi:type VI secretion system secreted protein VgrG
MKGGVVNKLTALLFWPALSVCLNAQVALGPTVSTFAVLGGSTVTNTGPSVITGNLGVSPGTAVTGFPPGVVTGGTIHAGDATAAQAQSDLTTAYNSAVASVCPGGNNLSGQNLGGLTLTPGVYCFNSSAQLTGALILNAGGNQNAQFIFQIGSTLTTASNSSVIVNNGQAGNVFWQVGSSATLGTGTAFAGNILALTSITLTTGATILQGRALARNGAVTLDTNTVGIPVIVVLPPPATPAPSSLILVAIGLVGAGIYQTRKRLFNLLSRN